MKTLQIYGLAVAFSVAGMAVHANAATAKQRGDSTVCFQLSPLTGTGALAENGFSRTPLGQWLEAQTVVAQA